MAISKAQESQAKNARLDLRMTADQKALIEQAAAVKGSSITSFVVNAAQREAQQVLRERQTMRLTKQDSEAFVRALLEAPRPVPRLKEAAKRYKSAMGR